MIKYRKYLNYLILIILSIIFVESVNASSVLEINAGFCQREEIARILKLIKLFVNIIRAAVPIILIISAMLKFIDVVVKKGDEFEKVKKTVVTNIVAAVLIFLIPTFVNIIAKITNTYNVLQTCFDLSGNPISTPGSGGSPKNPANTEKLPTVTSVTQTGGYVVVNAKEGNGGKITGYYFSKTNSIPSLNDDKWILKSTNKLEIVKLPNKYYVYVKDSSNKISKPVTLKFTYTDLYNEGTKSRNSNFPLIEGYIDSVLKSKGDSLSNLNDMIAWSVKSAGLFTNEGVATAGISAQSYLHAKYNIHISYISNIHCFNQRYNIYFGANPKFGQIITLNDIDKQAEENGKTIYPRELARQQGIKKYCMGLYGGLDCQSFFGWAVHNGGFKAENTHHSYVGNGKAKELTCGTSCSKAQMQSLLSQLVIGDEMINPAHVMLFLSFYDDNKDGINDGVYVYEGTTPIGMGKYSWTALYSSQYFTINKMEGYYNNSKNYACLQNSQGNIVSIPDAWKDKVSLFRNDCKA